METNDRFLLIPGMALEKQMSPCIHLGAVSDFYNILYIVDN